MVRAGRSRRQSPIVSIVMNIAASGATPAHCLANMGVALCAVVDRLEAVGYRVELTALWVTNHYLGDVRGAVGWTVKRAEDSLDLGALAFSVAHPAASRRIAFALCERQPREIEGSGYGTIAPPLPIDWPDAPPGALFLAGLGTDPGGQSAATIEAVLATLQGQINSAAGSEIVALRTAYPLT